VERYGAREMVTFHPGYFSDSLRGFEIPPLISLWMDVDLEFSAKDVMTTHNRIDPRGAVFTHESEARFYEDGRIVVGRDPDVVLPIIADAFEQAGAPPIGRHLHGYAGSAWESDASAGHQPQRGLFVRLTALPPAAVPYKGDANPSGNIVRMIYARETREVRARVLAEVLPTIMPGMPLQRRRRNARLK
jgi:hypothetical protein